MTRPRPTAADRGTYIGLLRAGLRDAARRREEDRRPGDRLDQPLAPGERLSADGDRLSPREA